MTTLDRLATGRWLWLIAAALILAGCGRAAADHDEHLEHHVPPHRPANFAAATAAIPRRWHTLEIIGQAGDPAAQRQRLDELLDIIRWLPELAGDSDLPEEPWDRVNALAQELHAHLRTAAERWPHDPSAKLPPLSDSQPLLDELKQLACISATAVAGPPPTADPGVQP